MKMAEEKSSMMIYDWDPTRKEEEQENSDLESHEERNNRNDKLTQGQRTNTVNLNLVVRRLLNLVFFLFVTLFNDDHVLHVRPETWPSIDECRKVLG